MPPKGEMERRSIAEPKSTGGATESVRIGEAPRPARAPVTIHFGLHRTGTTTLQYRVFPRLPGVDYVHKPSREQLRQIAPRDDRPLVLSHEGFLMRHSTGVVRTERVEELGRRFPDALPMLTLRRPDRWLRSLYVYKVFKGESRAFEEFVRWREPGRFLDYIRLIESTFGQPPQILFQEELNENPQAVIELIAHWTGASSPPPTPARRLNRRSDQGLAWVLWFNRRFPRRTGRRAFGRKLRLNARQAAAHGAGVVGSLWPGRASREAVSSESMRAVQAQWEDDWLAALRLAADQRPLLSETLRRELEASEDRSGR